MMVGAAAVRGIPSRRLMTSKMHHVRLRVDTDSILLVVLLPRWTTEGTLRLHVPQRGHNPAPYAGKPAEAHG